MKFTILFMIIFTANVTVFADDVEESPAVTQLIDASRSDIEQVTKLINSQDYSNYELTKALEKAVDYNKPKIATFLFKHAKLDKKTANKHLLKGAEYGHTAIVQLLLENGADINTQTFDVHVFADNDNWLIRIFVMFDSFKQGDEGFTALMLATNSNEFETVDVLVKNGAKLDLKNDEGQTALTLGLNGYTYAKESVHRLVKAGVNVNVKGEDGNPALHIALKLGDTVLADKMILAGADIYEDSTKDRTTLMMAAFAGHKRLVEFLIEKKQDVNAKNIYSETALMYGLHEKVDITILDLLLKAGADVNAIFSYKTQRATPLLHASKKRKSDIVRFLIENGAHINEITSDGESALWYAVDRNDLDLVTYLIDKGALVNPLNSKAKPSAWSKLKKKELMPEELNELLPDSIETVIAKSPLNAAISEGNIELVKYLMSKGAKFVKAGSENEKPSLLISLIGDKKEQVIFDLLIAAGANIAVVDNDKNTIAHKAASKKNMYAFEYISKHKPELLTQKNNDGMTPLMEATEWRGWLEGVKFLVGQGANINEKNKHGNSAIKLSRDFEIVRYLHKQGANIKEIDSEGENFLFLLKPSNKILFEYLVANGLDINLKNNRPETMLTKNAADDDYVHFLVTQGANIKQEDAEGYSVLGRLIEAKDDYKKDAVEHYLKTIELLLNKGANPNKIMEPKDKTTPLLVASSGNDQPALIKLLIKHGANINSQDTTKETPIFYAIRDRNKKAITALLELGANINHQNTAGITPLILQIYKYSESYSPKEELQVILELLDSKADVNLADEDDQSALFAVVLSDEGKDDRAEELITTLLKYGADITIKDKTGKTVINYAKENGGNLLEVLEASDRN